MADYEPAFEKMIANEGGYRLHDVRGDRGGQTYAGIARNFHPNWPGWQMIDNHQMDDPELTRRVRDFYKTQFWDRVRGDDLQQQRTAESLFDFAVNAGYRTATKLAQVVVDATPDGVLGPKTLGKLNAIDGEDFVIRYALAKVARYAEIVNRNRDQGKFLLGWINRTLKGVA
jgi:lysozyme family protein